MKKVCKTEYCNHFNQMVNIEAVKIDLNRKIYLCEDCGGKCE